MAVRLWITVLAVLTSCASGPPRPTAEAGVLDLTGYDWSRGPVALVGEWQSDQGFATVPETWPGRGSRTYRLTVQLPSESPPLALRYGTASTAFSLKQSGVELVRVGNPAAVAERARPAFSPGTVALRPSGPEIRLEVFVSNHEYRVGGLWTTPSLGPAGVVAGAQRTDELLAVALSSALGVIGLSTLILFGYRRTEKAFLHLGIFALLVALRSLVTGEYPLVHLWPGLPFDLLIRLEYLTAYLPLPSAVLFFAVFLPQFLPRWAVRLMTWPSWAFALSALVLPLEPMTQIIPWFYPAAVPALVIGTGLLIRRILRDQQNQFLLVGVGVLASTGLADMLTAAFLTTTGNLVPWGLGAFVALQTTTLAQQFLAQFQVTEALLAEKNLLVKEIHHRVKNSLQVVASLVSLQSNRTSDPAQKEVFQALRQRIIAIGLVHEKLYGQGIGGRLKVGEYLADLLKLQYQGDRLAAGGVSWKVETGDLAAEIDYCVDAGLIVTELVGNAFKHALKFREGGRVLVRIHPHEGRLRIEVEDDGPGFPPDFRSETAAGMGFRLVQALMQRSKGALTVLPGPGGRVRVDLRFPNPV